MKGVIVQFVVVLLLSVAPCAAVAVGPLIVAALLVREPPPSHS